MTRLLYSGFVTLLLLFLTLSLPAQQKSITGKMTGPGVEFNHYRE